VIALQAAHRMRTSEGGVAGDVLEENALAA
jgi:hypothetical protein